MNMDTPLQPAETAHPVNTVDMSSIPYKNISRGFAVGPMSTPPDDNPIASDDLPVAGPDASVEATPAELDQYFFDPPGDKSFKVCSSAIDPRNTIIMTSGSLRLCGVLVDSSAERVSKSSSRNTLANVLPKHANLLEQL